MCNNSKNIQQLFVVVLTTAIIVCVIAATCYVYLINDKNNAEYGMESLQTIRMAAILFRHGERNPDASYPTDPNYNYSWPGGYGALVPQGVLNLYKVGEKLRKRYAKLIPQDGFYHQNAIRVTSSAFERCLMSGQSFLAGFLPPEKHSHELPFEWQPVPIHVVPRKDDHYLSQLAPCPIYDQMYTALFEPQSEFYNEAYGHFSEIYAFLTNKTGKHFKSTLQIEGLYATFMIQQSVGLMLPEWSSAIFPDRMRDIVKIIARLNTTTEEMKRIKGGPLLTQILDNMTSKKLKTLNPDRSLLIYSGHDITIKSLLNTVGVMSQTGEMPDFGATLAFELHENELIKDDLEIRIIYYRDGYCQVPISIQIPNCEDPCPFDVFTKLMKPYMIRNIEEVCK